MLDERHVDGLPIVELDDPLLAADLDERLRLGPAETAAGGEHLALELADGALAPTLCTTSLKCCACIRQTRRLQKLTPDITGAG